MKLLKLLKSEVLEMAVSWQELTVGSITEPTTTTPHAAAVDGYGNAPYDITDDTPGTFTDVALINLELFTLNLYLAPTLYRTITAGGTTGNQTINKPAGTVNIAAGQGAVTVTNSLVTANSIILTSVRTADATLLYVKSVVAGSGTFTITCNANATAETSIWFVVIN